MKRYRWFFPALLMLLLLLTGCTPDVSLDVTLQNLPEGERAYLLLMPPEGTVQTDSAPEDLKGSEIERYAEDGFVCAEYRLTDTLRVHNASGGKHLGFWFDSSEALRGFCAAYREFRVARCDSRGNVLQVGPSVSLCPKNRFAYAFRLNYDVKTDTAEITALLGKTVFGASISEWIFALLLVTLPACMLMLLIYAFMRIFRRKQGIRKRVGQTVSLLCSLPPLLLNLLLLLERAVPYFRAESRPLPAVDFRMILAADLIWFASLLICGYNYYRSNA